MITKAYKTGTIELMPHPEHGEFCIVGVFAVEPNTRQVYYRIQDSKKTKRLTGFFPELERKLFQRTLTNLQRDWKDLTETVNQGIHTPEFENADSFDGHDIFHALVHPREGMIRQKGHGVILTTDIEAWLDDAFRKMVMRVNLNTEIPDEQQLTRHVGKLLKQWKLADHWKEAKVGRDDYHATFPFAYTPEGSDHATKVIKPLYLGQETATKIIDHGDTWLQKVRRLRYFKVAPDLFIFPVQRPADNDTQKQDHAELVIKDLKAEGIHVVEYSHLDQIRDLARINIEIDTPLFSGKPA